MKNKIESGVRRDLDLLWHSIRSHAWKIVALTLLTTGAGVAYVTITPKMYLAQAIIQVEQTERHVTSIQDVTQEDFRAVETLKTLEARMTTDEILSRVIRANHLETDPQFAPSGQTSTEDQIVKRLRGVVKVKLQRSTRLISVGVECYTPENAQKLSGSLVEELMKQDFELRAGITKNANQFLVKQAEEWKIKLEKSEQALQKYREDNQAVSLEEKQNIVVDKLKDLNRQLTEASNVKRKLQSDYLQFSHANTGSPEDLLTIPTIANSPDVQLLRRAVSDQEAQISVLSKRYRAEHPQYIEAHSHLQQLEDALNKGILKAGAGMKAASEAAEETERRIQEALNQQQQEAMELARLAIPYTQLQREVDSEAALYQSVLNRLKETDVTAVENHDNLRLVQTPRLEHTPSKPKVPLILLASVAGGLLAGFGLALTLESLDNSLRTLRDMENALGVTASAAIPKGGALQKEADRLVVWKQPDSPIAEAFRSLRATLALSGHDSDRPAIVFTSSIPGEGKSLCSINYATVLSQQGLKTLLIDAELRKSTVSAAILGEAPALGLGEYLDGKCSLPMSIHSTEIPNLSLLPCGGVIPNPAELMASPRALGIVEAALAAGFDRIVFDVGPMNSVSDAVPLIKRVQQVCFIVKASGAAAASVERAYSLLTQIAGKENVHVVGNLLPLRAGGGCYYHYMTAKYGDRPVYGRPIAPERWNKGKA